MSDVRGEDPTVAGSASEPAELVEHERVAGRWEILALVGSGGMGNVYRALDHELGETVALKVVRRSAGTGPASPAGGTTDVLDRFRHEVKLARRVTHVNVARTHDIGKHGDSLFLTMELVDGESLSRRILRGPVPWREAVSIARGICAGVGAAHAAGVVHRDLKPDNVMLARDGRVVVTDFGIAAAVALARGDQSVEVTGTPGWMAPEQLAGDSDARSDVYAIGEILWTMLTGVHPWLVDGRIQVTSRVSSAPPRLPLTDIPETLSAVIDRCMVREPSRRYRDASDVGLALSESESSFLTGTSTPRPVTTPRPNRDVHVGVDAIRNLGDAADDFVAAGLVEDLIDMLGRAHGIRVCSMAGATSRPDLDVIVSGSLRRIGDMVRISVRAVGARDGFQIWSQRFDRRLDEILRVSDEVARDVATALSATATSGGVGRDIAADQVVVELYLRARQLAETAWLDDPRPLTLYQAALDRDPDSPVVLAAYATLLARRLNAADGDGGAVADEAEALARRAIAHGPRLGEPWMALSVVYYNQSRHVLAFRASRIALALAPGLAEASDAAGRMLLEHDSALEESVALLERARWTNPRLPGNLVDLVRAYALRGDWRKVDDLLAHPGTESAPAQMIARARMAIWRGIDHLAHIPIDLPGLGRFRWITETVVEAVAAGTLIEAGMTRWRQRLDAIPDGSRVRRYFAQLGVELATRFASFEFAWEMLAVADRSGLLDVCWLDRMPLLGPMRSDPRFAEIRARVVTRGAPALAAWRGPMPLADVDRWLAEKA